MNVNEDGLGYMYKFMDTIGVWKSDWTVDISLGDIWVWVMQCDVMNRALY